MNVPLCIAEADPGIGGADSADESPDCFAQLKYRDVEWAPDLVKRFGITDILPADHSFWWVQNRKGQRFIISGGPDKIDGVEYLRIWTKSGDANGMDNSGQRLAWSSTLRPSRSDCDSVDRMLAAADSFPKGRIKYDPFNGPNSNSAARYIGGSGGFSPNRPSALAFGWEVWIGVN